MIGRPCINVVSVATALLVVGPALLPAPLAAQDESGRFRVLVIPFSPLRDADDDFGKDTAKKLREQMEELPRHRAIDKDELDDLGKSYQLKLDEALDCLSIRQLGSQINAQVALCAQYTEVDNRNVRVEAEFWDLQSSQNFSIEPFSIRDNQDDEAAALIIQAFNEYVEAFALRELCFRYADQNAFQDSIDKCDEVLASNPDDLQVREQKANSLYALAGAFDPNATEFDRELMARAYEEIARVVQADPGDQDALQLAGFIAVYLGRNEEGLAHYRTYLDLNPGDLGVRRTIAFKIYDAGDPIGAIAFLEEGEAAGDPEVQVELGNYAFAAWSSADRGRPASEAMSPEARALLEKAVESYMAAFPVLGDSMKPVSLRNVVTAQISLDQVEAAIATAEQILQVHDGEAGIWDVYGKALRRAGRLEDALEAMDRVEALDPEFPNLYALRGQWLVEAGRLEDGAEMLKRAVAQGEDPNRMAWIIYAAGRNLQQQQGDNQGAIRYMLSAKGFDLVPERRMEIDFWHGYYIRNIAASRAETRDLPTARATLPQFQEAKRLMLAGKAYADGVPGIDLASLIENTDRFIEIQETIIRRAGG